MVKTVSDDRRPRLHWLLDCAIQATAEECESSTPAAVGGGKYEKEIAVSDCLCSPDTKGAMSLITQYVKDGIPLNDIYVDIVAETMTRIGDMWHRHIISVDMEHYSTPDYPDGTGSALTRSCSGRNAKDTWSLSPVWAVSCMSWEHAPWRTSLNIMDGTASIWERPYP